MLLTYYSAIVATILGAQIVQAAPADIRAARSPSTVADVVSSPEVQPAEGVVGGENNIVDDFEEPPIPAFPPPLMVRSRNAHWFVVIKHQGKTVCNGMWVTHTLVLTTARCAATFQAVEDGENDAHDPSDMSIHTVDTEVPVELVLLAGVDSVIYDSTAIFEDTDLAFLHVREAREHLVQRHFGPSLDVKRTFRFGKDYLDLTGEEMRLARYGADNFMYARVRHGMIDFKYGNMAMNQETCEELIATRMEAEGAVVTGEEDFSNKVCIQNVRNLKPGTPFGLDIHGQFIVYGLVQGWIQGVDQNGKGTIIITMLQASHNWIDSVINQ